MTPDGANRDTRWEEVVATILRRDIADTTVLGSDLVVTPISRNLGSKVFRVSGQSDEVALKVFHQDQAWRARAELDAIGFLESTAGHFCPRLTEYSLDRPAPFVALEWIDSVAPPTCDARHLEMVTDYLASLHTVDWTQHTKSRRHDVRSTKQLLAAIEAEVSRLRSRNPQVLAHWNRLREEAETNSFDAEPESASFCKGDLNFANFLFASEGLTSIDWEYGGIGDTAYELADLATHPSYLAIDKDTMSATVRRYANATNIRGQLREAWSARRKSYERLNLFWWYFRIERELKEMPDLFPRREARQREGILEYDRRIQALNR